MSNSKTYFVRYELGNNPANKLQDAIQAYFKRYQNFTITDPEALFQIVDGVVNALNAEHPRCRPEKAGRYSMTSFHQKVWDNDHVVFVSGVFQFDIRPIHATWGVSDGYKELTQKGGEAP